jgi:hypothetical protein
MVESMRIKFVQQQEFIVTHMFCGFLDNKHLFNEKKKHVMFDSRTQNWEFELFVYNE